MENVTKIEKYITDNYLYKSARIIGIELNLHQQVISDILKRLNLNRKQYIDNYVMENYYKEGSEHIGKLFNYNSQSIGTIARKLGLETKKPKKENLKKEFVKANYESMGGYKIAEILGCSYASIIVCARRLGLSHERIFPLDPNKNEDYFKVWSHDMAYILGFTISDGYVSSHNDGYYLYYGLNTKDKSVLEFIKDKISPKSIVRDSKKFDKRTNKYYDKSILKICSKEIVKSLIDLGVIQAKTGKEILPSVPEEYKFSLLCGIHDGDGHLRACTKRGYHFEFTCASEQLLKSIQSEICGGLGEIKRVKNKNYFKYLITRKEPCQSLDAKMIENVSFYLKRKHFTEYDEVNENFPEYKQKPELHIVGTI